MITLTATCPAKINLGLEVTGRRADGYHTLVTIFQALALSDTLSVAPADDLSLECTDATLTGPDNLCLRAAAALRAATGTRHGARVRLVKRIPAAAGLGGGSSDAALTLRLLDRLWGTALGTTDLATLAASLGADVPFFLNGPTALATGVGEVLTPLPPPPPTWLVLLRPALTLTDKTARLYRALTPADWSDGSHARAQAERLRAGQPLDPVLLVNVFTRPLLAIYPAVAAAMDDLRAAGATVVFPAGSGPTLVALCPDQPAARRLALAVTSPGRTVLVTCTADALIPG
jgi:4-diphosphocytidyl-2-C-methyl-D-erythritol kinase